MSVGDGDALFLDHHVASNCDFVARPKHLCGTRLISGHPFPSSLTTSPTQQKIWTTSLQRSSAGIAWIESVSVRSMVPRSSLEKVLAAMQEPSSELTYLRLSSNEEPVPIVPDSFLGRSAPRLRYLVLDGIPVPGLPKLLLSATNLVELQLSNIPHSGYISPDAVVTALSALTSLQLLQLEFRSPRSHPTRQADFRLPRHALSFLLLQQFGSKGSVNTWTTSWPASMFLNSLTCI
jgi:hypothetical protein